MSHVEETAAWAASLDLADVPAQVVELCRVQRRSVLGGVAASARDGAARRVADAVTARAGDGPAPLFGSDRTGAVEDALYLGAAWSIALDFDDYVCFGHTGHSAVLVPILLATETGSDAHEQLVAQVVANEVGARLGGAALIGPLNGQLWSFVHAASSALAAGRLLGLDATRLAHALALALTNAPRPTVPGFMAPDSKLVTASEPAVAGLRAARLAAAGVTGPLDVLDHPQGFLSAVSFVPLRNMLGGLGTGWATRTLCVKPYPGCAYVDTTIDALMALGPPPAEAVAGVEVEAGLLTCGMDEMSGEYASAATPVTVNFSVPWNVAVVLEAGELGPDVVTAEWLDRHDDSLRRVRDSVQVTHAWDLSLASAATFAEVLPPRALLRDASPTGLLRGLRRLRETHRGLGFGIRDLTQLVPLLVGPHAGFGRGPRHFWDDEALARFEMRFPVRVRVRMRDGGVEEADVGVPRGAAGNPDVGPAEIASAKLRRYGPMLWGGDGTAALEAAITSDADAIAAGL
ncbi:MAG: MmgE/PrpD family protein [Acidimicrobiia bacterium]|nr:MmgE/PrpD family protein [Acidimicrobiia bacterium]